MVAGAKNSYLENMPKFEISKSDLEKLVGKRFSLKDLEDALLFAKTELDSHDGDKLKVDVKDTNRPDLWSVEGIARELKGHLRKEDGLPKYTVKKAGWKILVGGGKVQPFTTAAIVRNLKIDKNVLAQMIQLQEKIAGTFGRNRKSISSGAYDLSKIEFPLKYTAMKPWQIKFRPLGFPKELSAKEIIENHPKGKQYGHLLFEAEEYPVWLDAKNRVLSMPPIINSEDMGNVTEKAKDIFIECTGNDLRQLNTAINVLAAALAERGGQIEGVEIIYRNKKIIKPDLSPKKAHLDPEYCRKILGLEISDTEMIRLLKEARYNAKLDQKKIHVEYAAYRNDIMHQRDLVEDVAISFGYNDIEPQIPKIPTVGSSDELEDFSNSVREICIGLGLQEVLTFTLTNKENMFKKMNLPEGKIVEIENPMSANWCSFRDKLMPNLLEFLSFNKNQDYPQCIFEVGDVVLLDTLNKETGVTSRRMLSSTLTNTQIGYEDVSSILSSLLLNLGLKAVLKKTSHNSFIQGRAAEVVANGRRIGLAGEIHPQVLNNWNLEKPVAGFEIDLEEIFNLLNNR